MRYLFIVIAVCLPTWGAADILKADKRYLCEAETTFGWPPDAELMKPEIWVSRTKYVIEPAPQQMEQYQLKGPTKDVEVTHTVKELGKDSAFYCTTVSEDLALCFPGKDVLFNEPSFVLKYNDNANLNFYYESVTSEAIKAMFVSPSSFESIAFEAGSCTSF